MTDITERTAMNRVKKPDPAPGDSAGPVGNPKPHNWMMVACCVPMLVLAVALVASGAVSFGFLFLAIGCTAMMAMMMRGMGRGSNGT